MINQYFSFKTTKIIFILIISFSLVKIITPQIFLANSPKINPLFIAKLKTLPSYFTSIPKNITKNPKTDFKTDKKNDQKLTIEQFAVKNLPPNLVFTPVAKNISAAEDPKTKKIYLKIKPGSLYWIEEVEINGVKRKVIKIKKE